MVIHLFRREIASAGLAPLPLLLLGRTLLFAFVLMTGCSETMDADQSADGGTSEPTTAIERPSDEGIAADPDSIPLRHPLQGVELVQGKVPGVDLHRSPSSGRKYAVGEYTRQPAEGTLRLHESGVIEIDSTFASDPHGGGFPVKGSREAARAARAVSGAVAPRPKVSARLRQVLAGSTAPTVRVVIRLQPDVTQEHLFTSLEREIGLGNVKTRSDRLTTRRQLLDQRESRGVLRAQGVVGELQKMGARHRVLGHTGTIHAEIPVDAVATLSARADVLELSVPAVGVDEQASFCWAYQPTWLGTWIDGVEVIGGSQISQFVCQGFDGKDNFGERVGVAVVESGVSVYNYPFNDSSGSSNYLRLNSRKSCGWFYCSTSTSGDGTAHATMVTGLIVGDLHDSQDSNVTSSEFRASYSGYSHEARANAYMLENGLDHLDTVVEEVLEESWETNLMNMSYGFPKYDSDGDENSTHSCDGDEGSSIDANVLFENGVLLIKSAGNDGNTPANGCTVSHPGSAIGVVTVGAHGSYSGGISTVRSGAIQSTSSRGGDGNRTLLDLTAQGCRRSMVATSWGSYNEDGCGTSFAAPTVTAAAANFIDFYRSIYSSWIENPGAIYANLLLMGDGQGVNGLSQYERYNSMWGAGRMHMRMFNDAGMDAPWGYGRYSTCVDDGETVSFNIGRLAAGTQVFNAVAYWYDRTHPYDGFIDDIDLRIRIRRDDGSTWTRSSLAVYENKERVRGLLPTNTDRTTTTGHTIELHGYDVDADHEGCGTNSMRVYIAWYFEDTRRDDADGPGSEILILN